MTLAYLSFTEKGFALAQRLAGELGGCAARCNAPLGLREWTEAQFAAAEGLVFVGAAGIAVRAIAPYVKSKAADPAVVAVDECARFAVPLLSGHLGGANDLARRIAAVCGAVPVITTATDANGVFAVDAWARRQGCRVLGTEKIKRISARLLAGGSISVCSDWPIEGDAPPGVKLAERGPCEVRVSLRAAGPDELHVVPRIAVLGVGCRKGTSCGALEQAFAALVRQSGVCPQAVCAAASIDLKKNEPGLVEFCERHGWPFITCSAEALRAAPGEFTPSAFVQSVTGVDNVCERAAAAVSGGSLLQKKLAGGGVTMALAQKPCTLDWSWKDE